MDGASAEIDSIQPRSNLILLILAASVAILRPAAAQGQSDPRIVEVDGRSVRVVTAGFEDREPGQPVVVFESGGGGDPLEIWDPVVDEVARFAPVVTYERAGIGVSEPDTTPPTLGRINESLHALLRAIEADPPYVLVGHSFGGPLIRYFAGRYPDKIAGLVYVDAAGLTQTTEDQLAVFESMGAGEAEPRDFQEVLEGFVERMPVGPLPPHPDVPISVRDDQHHHM